MKKLLFTLILIFFFNNFSAQSFAQTSEAQNKKIERQRAALKRLDFLIGKWSGRGWMIFGPDRRETFSTTETVQSKLGGLVVMFEGLGTKKDEKTGAEMTGHNALGFLSYDDQQNVYRWKTFTMQGNSLETTAEIGDKKFVWKYEIPNVNGIMRYTITLNEKGNWLETGEFSRDAGKTWFKNFEMELQKIE